MGTVIAESERVVLRHWDDGDVDDLAAIGTLDVVRFLGGVPWTRASAEELIALYRSIQDRLGLTTWAVELKAGHRLIGTCGFAGTNVAWLRGERVIEIGWTLGREWWGLGLATEAALLALTLAESRFGRDSLVSKCAIQNVASEAVMRRIGMRRVGVVQGQWTSATVLCRFP